jgi:hypothetical protein
MDHAKIVKGRMVSVGEENLLAVIVMINVSLEVRAANSSMIKNCFLGTQFGIAGTDMSFY